MGIELVGGVAFVGESKSRYHILSGEERFPFSIVSLQEQSSQTTILCLSSITIITALHSWPSDTKNLYSLGKMWTILACMGNLLLGSSPIWVE